MLEGFMLVGATVRVPSSQVTWAFLKVRCQFVGSRILRAALAGGTTRFSSVSKRYGFMVPRRLVFRILVLVPVAPTKKNGVPAQNKTDLAKGFQETYQESNQTVLFKEYLMESPSQPKIALQRLPFGFPASKKGHS